MAYIKQVILQHSVICWLVLHMSFLHSNTCGITVYLNYTSSKVKGQAMPDELNITLTFESGLPPIYLHLKYVHHLNPNVPVVTLNVDKEGKLIYHYEKLEDKLNIGYYQDVNAQAGIEVTRVDGLGGKEAHLLFKGELNVKGTKYWLSTEGRTKSETSLSSKLPSQSLLSEDIIYSLLPRATSPVLLNDYVDIQTEVKRDNIETVKPEVPGTISSSSSRILSSRERRQSQTINIDVVAVADYKIYRRFEARSKTKTATLQAIRDYFSFIFYDVDLLYQGITTSKYAIRVRLIKLIIAENSTASNFTETLRRSYNEISAFAALNLFSDYVGGPGKDVLLPYDHVMLFTGYVVVTISSNGTYSYTEQGMAFPEAICRIERYSISVVQDIGGFQSVNPAAHQLGHGLSAIDTGDNNGCNRSDNYIMAPGNGLDSGLNDLNAWKFSPCRIEAFDKFISYRLTFPENKTCLLQQLPISADVVDVSKRLPGQEFTAKEQCKMIYGDAGRYCKRKANVSEICTKMHCAISKHFGMCHKYKAARGTTCGEGKLCFNGQCVPDPRSERLNVTRD